LFFILTFKKFFSASSAFSSEAGERKKINKKEILEDWKFKEEIIFRFRKVENFYHFFLIKFHLPLSFSKISFKGI